MPTSPNPSTRRVGFTLVELLVVIAIIGILVALLLPAVQAARESARRTQCKSQLREMGLALQNYHDARRHFPAGRNSFNQFGTSWAFEILPYMEQQAVYDSYVPEQRVDSPANAGAMRTPIPFYACPSRRPPAANRDFDDNDSPSQVRGAATLGDYAAVAGMEHDIGMEDNDFIRGQIDMTIAGPIFSGSKIAARRVTDGLSNTIAIGEKHIRPEQDDWTDGTQHVLQGDSCFLAADSIDTILRGTERGLAANSDDDGRHLFGSEHPGIVQFVFLDGHAESFSTDESLVATGVNPNQVEDIRMDEQWNWLLAYSSIAGGDIVQED